MRKLIIIAVMLTSPMLARAEEIKTEAQAKKNYVGALFGPSISTRSGGTTSFAWGGRIGTGLIQEASGIFSLGLYVQSISDSQTVSGIAINTTLTALALELITRRAFGSGLYLGGRFGVGLGSAKVSVGSASTSGSSSSFFVGPVLGYEFEASDKVSIGIDASWATVGKATMAFDSGSTIELGSSSAVILNAGVTYHW